MGGGTAGSARLDAPQFANIALPVVVFLNGGYSGNRFLEEYGYINIFLFVVRCQLRVVICAYRTIQVPTLADLAQEGLVFKRGCSILRQLVRIHLICFNPTFEER